MPVFYTRPVDPPATVDQQVTNEPQRKQLKRDYMGNIMGTRRSISPENGGMVLTTEDGRPISRGEIIERLKRSKRQSWTAESAEPPAISIPLRPADEPDSTRPTSLNTEESENYAAGMNIERPRSALHSGDFREQTNSTAHEEISSSQLQTQSFDNASYHQSLPFGRTSSHLNQQEVPQTPFGARSYASTFLPPTSPLIHASTSTDLDDLDFHQTPSISSRRRTFSPPTFQSSRSETDSSSFFGRLANHPASRAHQPYRSISIPQTSHLRSRGIAGSSDASPLQHAPMVGSFEESILRGRMSAIPSRPLDFIAQIGVLGRGKCKPSLRCPAHVSVPFPAVFYSYNGTAAASSSPSPYVGLIDLEHSFPEYDGKAPAGGCYRIPQQGQLQIIIKNPNKTAVKLFLVPYDLSDMEPGTKTFIRQRSYSAGPIIDMPISSRSNLGTDRPEAALSQSEDPTDRPTLRYLIHLHICCTARGRYFLYRSIRVVFANRVPDGKEKLRNEVQFPEPRYVPYRPGSTTASATSSPYEQRRQSRIEQPLRRLSTPFAFAALGMDQADGLIAGPASQGTLPLSTAAIQRKLSIPARQPDAQSQGLVRPLSFANDITGSADNNAPARSTTPISPASPAGSDGLSSEPVLMESFDTWLNRRRRNAGGPDVAGE